MTPRELMSAAILSEFESRASRQVRATPEEHADAITDAVLKFFQHEGWVIVPRSMVKPKKPTLTEMGWPKPDHNLPPVRVDTTDPMS